MAYEIKGKAISIGVNDSWQIAVDDVSSSTYDSSMGALGSSNRRAIIVPPGSYNQGVTMREYVDIYEEVPGGTINTGVIVNTVGSGYYISGDSPGDGYSSSGNTLAVSSVGGAGDRFATLQAAYDWLKSSDRDAEMGALSTSDRELFINGKLVGDLLLDTNGVNIRGIEGLSTITGDVTQTCDTVAITNIQIIGDINLDSCDNTASVYTNLTYTDSFATNCDFGGTWTNCHADASSTATFKPLTGGYDITANCTDCSGKDYAWSGDIPFELDGLTYTHTGGTVERMLAGENGDFSFYHIGKTLKITDSTGGTNVSNRYYIIEAIDTENYAYVGLKADYGLTGDDTGISTVSYSDITGTLTRCTADNYSFNGCTGFAGSISGSLIDCTAGLQSFALQNVISGNLIRCKTSGIFASGGYLSGRCENLASSASNGAFGISEVNGGILVNSDFKTISTIKLRTATLFNCKITRLDIDPPPGIQNVAPVTIYDDGTKINNCTLKSTGTAASIEDDGVAHNVVVSNCALNNDPDTNGGLGGSLTNLITTPYNVVDDNI